MGLNNADIAFGRVSPEQILAEADWLAIFPWWFAGSPFIQEVSRRFEPRFAIEIPLEEYTVFCAPTQTVEVAYQKKVPSIPPANVAKPHD